VTSADHPFERRDAVELADPSGEVFAKGVTRMNHTELADAKASTGSVGRPVVVHADDLVVLAR
jgi:glutamate 5-kinase